MVEGDVEQIEVFVMPKFVTLGAFHATKVRKFLKRVPGASGPESSWSEFLKSSLNFRKFPVENGKVFSRTAQEIGYKYTQIFENLLPGMVFISES